MRPPEENNFENAGNLPNEEKAEEDLEQINRLKPQYSISDL